MLVACLLIAFLLLAEDRVCAERMTPRVGAASARIISLRRLVAIRDQQVGVWVAYAYLLFA